eukprot:1138996-Pelagomonas_calceolata.AAC.2
MRTLCLKEALLPGVEEVRPPRCAPRGQHRLDTILVTPCPYKPKKERETYVDRGNSPYITKGKGNTLAQKSHEPPPPQSYKTKNANGDLEGHWKHPAPDPGCEKCFRFQQHERK